MSPKNGQKNAEDTVLPGGPGLALLLVQSRLPSRPSTSKDGDISSTKEIRKGEVQKQIQCLISIHSNSIKKLGLTSTARDLTSEDGDINRKDRNLANKHGIKTNCNIHSFGQTVVFVAVALTSLFYEVILVAPVGPTNRQTGKGFLVENDVNWI